MVNDFPVPSARQSTVLHIGVTWHDQSLSHGFQVVCHPRGQVDTSLSMGTQRMSRAPKQAPYRQNLGVGLKR
ncbi:hypothetical protein THICB6_160182 [Thiomonas arsenitoxydans]|nr:hypothetical protein THICB6_160182 [Thiomonas arsenitoxydans]